MLQVEEGVPLGSAGVRLGLAVLPLAPPPELSLGLREAAGEGEVDTLKVRVTVPVGEGLALRVGVALPVGLPRGLRLAPQAVMLTVKLRDTVLHTEVVGEETKEAVLALLALGLAGAEGVAGALREGAPPVRVGEELPLGEGLALAPPRLSVALAVGECCALPEAAAALGVGAPPVSLAVAVTEGEGERLGVVLTLGVPLPVPAPVALALGDTLALAVLEGEPVTVWLAEGLAGALSEAGAEADTLALPVGRGEAVSVSVALGQGVAVGLPLPPALTVAVLLPVLVAQLVRLEPGEAVAPAPGEAVLTPAGEGVPPPPPPLERACAQSWGCRCWTRWLCQLLLAPGWGCCGALSVWGCRSGWRCHWRWRRRWRWG